MLRVMTWNVWWRFGPWEQRAPGIEATLRSTNADIILLQEVWAADGIDQAADLAARLGFHVVSGVQAADTPTLGNAILSRWPVVDHARTVLPQPNGQPGYRSLVRARVDSPHGLVDAYSTHLDHRFDDSEARSLQVAELCETISRDRQAGDREKRALAFPPILGGDLNATPESEEIRMLTGRVPTPVKGLAFTDAWDAVGDGPGFTWDERNPHLTQTTWPRRRLDYVLVGWPREKPIGNPVRARLAGARRHQGVWPSDHLAVVVDLATTPAGA